MKLRSTLRDSRRCPALPSVALLFPAVHGLRTTGTGRDSFVTQSASLITNHYSLITPFLIGPPAIRIAGSFTAIGTKCASNRSKITCSRVRFSQPSRSTNRQPHRNTHPFLIATRILEIQLTYSQQTRKFFLIATFSRGLAHAQHLAAHQARPTNHDSHATSPNSRYNRAFLRAAGQSNSLA